MQVRELTVGERTVIEKRLSTREREVPGALARFAQEATLLRLLDGVPTPRLVEHGTDEQGPFLRMERIAWPTLAARQGLAHDAPLEPGWMARATRASFRALARLHEATDAQGPLAIVHADLSPANVVVDDDGTHAVVLDLGLACWRESSAPDGVFRGTARYCAPEIARGERPTLQSDLFALAATLLHVATARVPRDAPSLGALLAVAAEQPLLASAHLAGVALEEPLVRCLAHEPTARPRSARAVLLALC